MRNLAEAMIGLGILFIGLDFIKNGVPKIQQNPEMLFLDQFTETGFASIVIFIIAGTILTPANIAAIVGNIYVKRAFQLLTF